MPNTQPVANQTINGAFDIKDCSLITISTGLRALNLREFRNGIEQCPAECFEYHFFATKLRPAFDDPEYPNDFAAWASHSLGDRALAERLGTLNPLEYSDEELLRGTILDILEEDLCKSESLVWAKPAHEFTFLRSQMVIYDTGLAPETPEQLAKLISQLSTGSVYYHFIESRRRLESQGGEGLSYERNDYCAWLESFGSEYSSLTEKLSQIDFYFCSLSELKDRISNAFLNI